LALRYRAAVAGKQLSIDYVIDRGYYENKGTADATDITGNVSLKAVSLSTTP
jgi:hypothetical protein